MNIYKIIQHIWDKEKKVDLTIIKNGIYIVEINNYVYIVPFVETENEIFLKTIIPSRKATKKYLEVRDEK